MACGGFAVATRRAIIGVCRRFGTYHDAMNDEPQQPAITQEGRDASNDRVIHKIGRGSKWVVPVTALSAAVVSITRLAVTPPSWLQKATDAAENVSPLDPDPIVCLALSGVTLTYWLSRDGWESIARLFAMFKYATADREERERIARRARAEGRSEGHSEGHSEGLVEGRNQGRRESDAQFRSWWEEATKGGTQPPSLDNPPPLTDGNEDDDDA